MTDFVQTSGEEFTLAGKRFPVVGANNYYLPYASEFMGNALLARAAEMRLNVLRTWSFFPQATQDTPVDFGHLDWLLQQAAQRNLRLILTLANHWPDFGGMDQYNRWFGITKRTQFYWDPRTRAAYQEWVRTVLLRVNPLTGIAYRDDPTVLAWELANEPRCEEHGGVETLLEWIDTMSRFVKDLDSRHLLAVGDEGYFRRGHAGGNPLYNGSFGVDFEAFLGLSSIDFGTCHLYPQVMAPDRSPIGFGLQWIDDHLNAAARAGKPMLLAEYGSKNDDNRNSTFDAWLRRIEESKGAGDLLWMLASQADDGKPYPDYDGYTVYGDADAGAIQQHAQRMGL